MTMDSDDNALVLLLASSSASLDESPNKNWVENSGNLPPYVRKLARGIMKSGKSKSQAIAIAISRIKVWAGGGGDVDADTRAKAAKALAQWEALKAKNKAKRVVKATNADGETYLLLAQEGMQEFEVDRVREAWYELQSARRRKRHEALHAAHMVSHHPGEHYCHHDTEPMSDDSLYIRSLWTTFIIVESPVRDGSGPALLKIPYTVTDTTVTFGEAEAVKTEYTSVNWDDSLDETLFDTDGDEDIMDLTPEEITLLSSLANDEE